MTITSWAFIEGVLNMIKTKKKEKRQQFGLRTGSMSDEVYEHLEKKAEEGVFREYMINLVRADIQNQKNNKELIELMSSFKTEMGNEIKDLKKIIKSSHIVVSNKPIGDLCEEEQFEPVDTLQEGLKITSQEVKGTVEEDLEYDF